MLSHSSDATPSLPPDPLSAVLQDLRLAGATYGRVELTAPWGIAFPPQAGARFHYVAAGQCWLRTASQGPVPLGPGDTVLLPHGAGHTLTDPPTGATTPLDDLLREPLGDVTYRVRHGGGGDPALLVCCSVGFDAPNLHPLLALMPELLLLRGDAATDPTLPLMLDTMAAEVAAQRIGAATVMARLADLIVTYLVRAWVEAWPDATTGWRAAVRDPLIGQALAAIHGRPGEPWSVATLAAVASLSRSRFAERFAAAVGLSPAAYLARWRMHRAAAWLRDDRLAVAEVAARLGYASEASFARAFKRVVGVPPGAHRARP